LVADAAIDGILKHEESRWWIDNRDSSAIDLSKWDKSSFPLFCAYFGVDPRSADPSGLWGLLMERGLSAMAPDEIYLVYEAAARGETPKKGLTPILAEEMEAAAEEEAARTIRPAQPKNALPAKIERLCDGKGDVRLVVQTPERNENLAKLLRKSGFGWGSNRWTKKLPPNCADAGDRIVEIAVHALSEGYAVTMPDKRLAGRALKADYQPLRTRLVRAAEGMFSISWDRGDGDFYESARRIAGARWDSESRSVKVPAGSFPEVEDFAERLGFAMSDKALGLAERARAILEKALVGEARPVGGDKPKPLGRKPEKLKAPAGASIDDSLLDDD
jgi:hypothetical protein